MSVSEPLTSAPGTARRHEADERALWAAFRSASSPDAFYHLWLALQSVWLDASAAILLGSLHSGEKVRVVAHWPSNLERPPAHLVRSAQRAFEQERGLALEIESNTHALPLHTATPRPVVLAQPIEVDDAVVAVVAMQIDTPSDADLSSALRRLAWGSAWVSLKISQGRADTRIPASIVALLDTLAAPLEHERFEGAASALTTSLATAFDCERAWIGFHDGAGMRLTAFSHSAQFSGRANLSRAVEAAMDESLDQGDVVTFPAVDDDTDVTTLRHAELADSTGAAHVMTMPLVHGARYCGAITLERTVDRPFSTSEIELLTAISEIAGPLLDLQRRDDRNIAAKILESFRTSAERVLGPGHAGTKAIAAGLVVLILLCGFSTGEHRVTADARIEAETKRVVIAQFDGYVSEALVKAGDRVEKGDLVVRFEDREYLLEKVRWDTELVRLRRQLREAMSIPDPVAVGITSAKIEQARARADLTDEKLARSRIEAPFDGVVVAGDLSQQIGSPVERGQILFEIAPANRWRLDLLVDERDVSHVDVGQDGSVVFTSSPEESLEFVVTSIRPIAEAREGQNLFLAEARLDSSLEHFQPGMEGVAKVRVGRRRLLWIWTHDVVDWLRLKLWTYLP